MLKLTLLGILGQRFVEKIANQLDCCEFRQIIL